MILDNVDLPRHKHLGTGGKAALGTGMGMHRGFLAQTQGWTLYELVQLAEEMMAPARVGLSPERSSPGPWGIQKGGDEAHCCRGVLAEELCRRLRCVGDTGSNTGGAKHKASFLVANWKHLQPGAGLSAQGSSPESPAWFLGSEQGGGMGCHFLGHGPLSNSC